MSLVSIVSSIDRCRTFHLRSGSLPLISDFRANCPNLREINPLVRRYAPRRERACRRIATRRGPQAAIG